ncbi:manganese transporter permease [Pseudorhodobacter turbinis]|uniref:Manganese transporter permease n=1 Tax=Pseudorhodobacter turbinis TaxID=2500533 RepID=A0A4P8EEC8_9RHOB|nr:UbiA family prenyltransferase [Pseudorhodobacter turbinis]QCO55079.1 manganese transporter permease [Pseudorhodobacter turbinis]
MNLSALWTYQAERFPLFKTVPLLAVFSAASICVSAELAGRSLPGAGAFLAGFTLAMMLFFQMRVCDEYKDLEDDRRFRPNRPIPRGLVSLRLIVWLGVASLPVAALAAFLWHPPVLWLLALVWIWLAAMTAEFGVAAWLKARPLLYLLSHMAIMPLIDLLLTGLEWMPGGGAASGLWMFLALSFVNGCVLEVGRKLWSPENEITGVETYSRLWGPRHAALVWGACVLFSFGFLLGVAAATGMFWISFVLGGAGVLVCLGAARHYARAPTPSAEKRMDKVAGLWVFACYGIAGFVPVLMRAI